MPEAKEPWQYVKEPKDPDPEMFVPLPENDQEAQELYGNSEAPSHEITEIAKADIEKIFKEISGESETARRDIAVLRKHYFEHKTEREIFEEIRQEFGEALSIDSRKYDDIFRNTEDRIAHFYTYEFPKHSRQKQEDKEHLARWRRLIKESNRFSRHSLDSEKQRIIESLPQDKLYENLFPVEARLFEEFWEQGKSVEELAGSLQEMNVNEITPQKTKQMLLAIIEKLARSAEQNNVADKQPDGKIKTLWTKFKSWIN